MSILKLKKEYNYLYDIVITFKRFECLLKLDNLNIEIIIILWESNT